MNETGILTAKDYFAMPNPDHGSRIHFSCYTHFQFWLPLQWFLYAHKKLPGIPVSFFPGAIRKETLVLRYVQWHCARRTNTRSERALLSISICEETWIFKIQSPIDTRKYKTQFLFHTLAQKQYFCANKATAYLVLQKVSWFWSLERNDPDTIIFQIISAKIKVPHPYRKNRATDLHLSHFTIEFRGFAYSTDFSNTPKSAATSRPADSWSVDPSNRFNL